MPEIPHGGSRANKYSLDGVIEPLVQGDRDESETTKECEDEGEGEIVNPLFGTIEEEPNKDGRKGGWFEVIVQVQISVGNCELWKGGGDRI